MSPIMMTKREIANHSPDLKISLTRPIPNNLSKSVTGGRNEDGQLRPNQNSFDSQKTKLMENLKQRIKLYNNSREKHEQFISHEGRLDSLIKDRVKHGLHFQFPLNDIDVSTKVARQIPIRGNTTSTMAAYGESGKKFENRLW
uniref:Uncharacterized protein n=1 Tax=Euplotes harpa TaxID=151035 RepID=A0A7S3JFM2_9SPIT|mmetsp:Transcript_33130/g.38057  ORF Transcript_33130/g.38057 Transcript_33130/m.38057 type:complete len:143 (+) Transcript_33130:415-843(+)